MLRQFRDEVECIKHADVLLEVLRVHDMKRHPTLERFVADFLEGDGWPRDVLRQAFLRDLVKDTDAVADVEPGVFPGQKVPGKVLVRELARHQELDRATPEDFSEGALVIKATLQDDGFDIEKKDNLQARKIFTQFMMLENIVVFLIVLVGVSLVLMSFEGIRKIGVSLIATAGIAGIIIGLAAQRAIATILAGIQIAISQPIRLDDVVIVEN